MKTAIYPGSFNPWHEGHQDILEKSLQIFDRVIIARGENPSKKHDKLTELAIQSAEESWIANKLPARLIERVIFVTFKGFLHAWVKNHAAYETCAVIRGLRNGYDLQYEINQQYWYEDLGLTIPIVYFITDRKLGHISSTAIREIEKIKSEK